MPGSGEGDEMPEFSDGMAETQLPRGSNVTTDVVVVGSGPAGAGAALFLSTLGIPNIMITKYRWTANTPRAHITNQRAMEVFRDVGIEGQVLADATPHELMGDTVFCTSIAGEEIGRILTWGTHPARQRCSKGWCRSPTKSSTPTASPA